MQYRCMIVAEIAQAHDGSLGQAHAYIDAAKKLHVQGVKFQMHWADEESTPAEPWRVQFSKQDASRFDYWKRMEFTESQWYELKAHCDEVGVEFICSPFSMKAVELLKKMGVKRWKVASGEVETPDMFAAMAETKLPMGVSTGMSNWAQIDRVVERVQKAGCELTLFQCTSKYPNTYSAVGLNVLKEFRQRYDCKVGFSDHSGQIYAALAATALVQLDAYEAHLVWHKGCFGPDTSSSLTPEQFKTVVDQIISFQLMWNGPVDKDKMAEELAETAEIFGKSLLAKSDLEVGKVLSMDDFIMKKPGNLGISAARAEEVIGKVLSRAVVQGEPILEKDIA
jgi:N,N'-diacetyllegionaminate synthase